MGKLNESFHRFRFRFASIDAVDSVSIQAEDSVESTQFHALDFRPFVGEALNHLDIADDFDVDDQ